MITGLLGLLPIGKLKLPLELSLRALRTDVIDIYLYHRDDLHQDVGAEIEVMEEFRRAGKIRYYGCSNWTAERMRQADAYARAHGLRGLIADQALFNLGVRHMDPPKDDTLVAIKGEVLAYHRENLRNLAIAYMGVAGGFFHHYLKNGAVGGSEYDTPGNHRLAELARKLMEQYGCTLTQALLGYLRCQDFPCLALYGPKTPREIGEAMEGLEIPFQREDYQEALM